MPKTPEERKAYLREYNEKNRERLRELKKRYYEENKQYLYEVSKETKAARKAKMTPEEREAQILKHREAVARTRAKYPERYRETAREKMATARSREPEKHAEYRREYDARHKDRISVRQKAYRSANPERERIRDGMVFAPGQTIASMREEQAGLCAICKRPLPDGRHTHVDHCHSTKDGRPNVRGLLCRGCNIGLGAFEDSPEFLRAAADYVEARQARLSALGQENQL